jgi:hypothetical protein
MGRENYRAYSERDKECLYKQDMQEQIMEYNQPERSKREDLSGCSNCKGLEEACENCFSQDGFCPNCGRSIRCGALNTMETS